MLTIYVKPLGGFCDCKVTTKNNIMQDFRLKNFPHTRSPPLNAPKFHKKSNIRGVIFKVFIKSTGKYKSRRLMKYSDFILL